MFRRESLRLSIVCEKYHHVLHAMSPPIIDDARVDR